MPVTTIADKEVHIDEEGFLTEFDEWDKDLAVVLASNIGIDDLTDDHWEVIEFLRADYLEQGETPTLRRVSTIGGIPRATYIMADDGTPCSTASHNI